MIIYLSSPCNQLQAQAVAGMPVLLSYAMFRPVLHEGYQQSFKRILIDSGAYSELNSGKAIDLGAYAEWAARWEGHADAVAGLDDIKGDWRRSLRNYEAFPKGFPTFHDSDPPDLLPDLVAMARERGGWLGIGLVPPRHGKEAWLRATLARVPADLHVHGWALREYTHVRRIDSTDSTNWFRDAFKLKTLADTQHLTYGECLEIVVKRYQRWQRSIIDPPEEGPDLFDWAKTNGEGGRERV